jgi:peptidoglycan/xylan/chitin deacetylase (PgdA/CDA1 family)
VIALWHRLPEHFERQLAAIGTRAEAYHFDDGYDDVLRAADALEAMHLRGVFFVTSGWIDTPGCVSGAQLRELVARGHEVGNHTRSHPMMPDLDREGQRAEIASAQVDLSWLLGVHPRRFAWPFGRHDLIGDEVASRFDFVEIRDISNVVKRIDRKGDRQLRRLFP